ncbi:glycosyltransferase [Gordonia pseudamarae]|jgi:sterol 3beta-glucosyltransferase|uniref:Glycosyltransferase n=1 Tax=Gordonia pseudamarae TaxID=2831662 RepID=A0ABX6IFJ6_9ACTN|nr:MULTISPECIES: glycosyltransferase [Gordonia]MBD0021545.1 glycosyltransferase family 1 protein [Gordonia sp. (in: high G+C Gram-positive bacteria)]QHN25162.1 glycosyltransferase [Gordonia pseudamarae]QHN34094.1 glycosyltransferase [Gordonia pseudamarae]
MRIVMAMGGSRGDVQPAVALGTELRSRGHDVVMAVPPDLVGFSTGAGLPAHPYGDSTRELLDSDLIRSELKSRNPLRRVRAISEITLRGGRAMAQQLLDLTEGADAVVAGSAGQERAHNVSQVRGIVHFPLHYCPIRRNRQVSPLAHLGIDVPGVVAEASWVVGEQILWQAGRRAEQRLTDELGLPRASVPYATQIARTGVPEIQAYDPALFPGLAQQWGARRPFTGFLNLAAAQRSGVGDEAPTDLLRWIADGPAPVYAGFGSMLPNDPQALAAALTETARTLDIRLLVAGGWSGFMDGADVPPDRVRLVGHVDHDTILPLCRAAIHHGGAGSVAAGLRAGLPTVVTWVGADQPIWGRALTGVHVGASLPMSRVTAPALTEAVRTVLSDEARRAARKLSHDLISPAEAVTTAANIIEHGTDG